MVRLTAISLLFLSLQTFGQGSLPVPDARFEGNVGRTYLESEAAVFPQPIRPPKDAPNVVLILLDDVGFGQFSTFGGSVPSPEMDKLAQRGIVYNRFHTAGICSPTRAALLTGRNPHSAGFGLVAELATGYDGYLGSIPRSTATIAEILKHHGYSTAMFGKNHNTPHWEAGPTGPFQHWPTGMGFDYFYGFNGWGTSNWQPMLFENTRPVEPSADPDYHLTTDLVDRAIGWMRTQKSIEPQKPFLLYLATGAMHAPHHAPREMIDGFKGKFDEGWDRYREEAFRKQKQLGMIPANTKLTPRPSNIPAWDELSKEEQHLLAYQMEIFAAFGAHTDREIGRLLSAVNALPDADNTLVIYIVGDNGASAEGGQLGDINEIGSANGLLPESTEDFTPEIMAGLGGPRYNNNFSRGWGWAMNTPFQYYKQVISHLGAIRNPLIISWPARIRRDDTVRSQFLHVTDIAPTILDAAGIDKPDSVNGIAQKPMDGVSILDTFAKADVGELRRTQHFEVFGNRAIYHDGWMASAPLSTTTSSADRSALHPDQAIWELYKLDDDFSQSDNLASRYPEKLRQLQDLWWARAGQSNVLPLDWRSGERLIGNARPNPLRGRDQVVFYPGMAALPEAIAPSIRNRSWSISAHGRFSSQSRGMLVTQGGMSGGWALYIQDGHLAFDYNYGSLAAYHVKSDTPLPAGAKVLEARFLYDGKTSGERGLGGFVTLWADGRKIGAGRLDKTISNLFSMTDGLDVGADYGSPVTSHYPMPFPFEGELERVELHLK